MVVAACLAAPFAEALAGFEPAYPARNPIAKGAGLATSLKRQNEKTQQPCAFRAYRFGLLQDEGIGDKRKVRLTQNALRILLDARQESKERAELIRQVALGQKIHQELWKKWGTNLPSDATLRHTLLLEWPTPFNENAVDYFIKEYRSTILYAKLLESDKVG